MQLETHKLDELDELDERNAPALAEQEKKAIEQLSKDLQQLEEAQRAVDASGSCTDEHHTNLRMIRNDTSFSNIACSNCGMDNTEEFIRA